MYLSDDEAFEMIKAEGHEVDELEIDGRNHHFMTLTALARVYDLTGKYLAPELRFEAAMMAGV